MKTIYFDCFSGISGDMIIGVLLDLGLDFNYLENELKKLKLKEYKLTSKKTVKKGITATKFNVITDSKEARNLEKINLIINNSDLEEDVKEKSKKIFLRIAQAESKIHNKAVEEVHFHEISGIDTIIDVVGTVIGLKELKINKIISSNINLGGGFVTFSHGKYPVPAPATAELLKNTPVYSDGNTELTTPTGAAIISEFAEFQKLNLKIEKVGYGAAEKDLEHPNVLRAYIGETEKNLTINTIETNIDDMNPEFYPVVMEDLMKAGALDVYLTNIIMKKGRPAIKLTVLCNKENTDKLCKIIFEKTTTIGLRIFDASRKVLERKIEERESKQGKVRVKVSNLGKIKEKVEFEDLKDISK